MRKFIISFLLLGIAGCAQTAGVESSSDGNDSSNKNRNEALAPNENRNGGDEGLSYVPRTRTYYIAAENVEWDYAPSGKDLMNNVPVSDYVWGTQTKYQKVRYIEYIDENFTEKKEQPEWLGILGPVIRGVEGDTIKVVFFNKGSEPYSIHPHGLLYDEDNEGAGTGKGAAVLPGAKFTYEWQVDEKSAPGPAEGSSKLWIYHSHVDPVADMYAGLEGAIIITSADYTDEDGLPNDVDKEFVTMFFVFNESSPEMSEEEAEGHLKHAINGYVFGNLHGLEMKKGERVRWHTLAMGTEIDLHTAHWHGERVRVYGRNTDVVELLPASMVSVDMDADNPGTWMLHCHVTDHISAGMMTNYIISE